MCGQCIHPANRCVTGEVSCGSNGDGHRFGIRAGQGDCCRLLALIGGGVGDDKFPAIAQVGSVDAEHARIVVECGGDVTGEVDAADVH